MFNQQSQVCCLTCKSEIGDHVGNASDGLLVDNAALHEMDDHCILKKCILCSCIGSGFNLIKQTNFHFNGDLLVPFQDYNLKSTIFIRKVILSVNSFFMV